VQAVFRLELRPPSTWRVFFAVLATWARYGCNEAWLTVGHLTRKTELSERTVKAALRRLVEQGVLARRGWYGRFAVTLHAVWDTPDGGDLDASGTAEGAAEGAGLSAPPRCGQACTSPTRVYCSLNQDEVVGENGGTFTTRQQWVIVDVLVEATDLQRADAADLPFADSNALGLPAGTTFRQAWQAVRASGDRGQAGQPWAAARPAGAGVRDRAGHLTPAQVTSGVGSSNHPSVRPPAYRCGE
jgi:hypothetical protein